MMCDRNTEPYRTIGRARFVGARELHLRLELRLIVIPAEPRTSIQLTSLELFFLTALPVVAIKNSVNKETRHKLLIVRTICSR
jgi:hypothetical protein